MADALVAFQGWNASGVAWGDQGWGQGLTPGVSATGAVGTVSVYATTGVDVFPTNVSATGAVGTVSVSGLAYVFPTTVSATGAVGAVSVSGLAYVYPTTVSATGAVGTVSVSGLANVFQLLYLLQVQLVQLV